MKFDFTILSDSPAINQTENRIELGYPCDDTSICHPYTITLPRGKYLFECYGASGGIHSLIKTSSSRRLINQNACIDDSIVKKYNGNAECHWQNGAGSGGYIAGTIRLQETTKIYAHVGGMGTYSQNKGGYNGGGKSNSDGSSGGGATDIRIATDDLQHRIIVAGGGGGTDNYNTVDDGAGGAGGYPEAQGYWATGVYSNSRIATQTTGFEFGKGQNSQGGDDQAGAGGGWFGGFTVNNYNAGAGGGSSFILIQNATIPPEVNYAFSTNSKYLMDLKAHESGIWSGNGKIIITQLSASLNMITCKMSSTPPHFHLFVLISLLK